MLNFTTRSKSRATHGLTTAVLAVFIFIALSPGSARAAEDRSVTAESAEKAPTIDGKLDDACWQSGSWSEGFVNLRPNRGPVKAKTRFKVRVGQGKLYLGVEMDRPEGGELVAEATEHDGSVWSDDDVELFLAPAPDDGSYTHIAVNPAGTFYDARRGADGQNESSLTLPLDLATAHGPKQWTVELALPLGYLNIGDAGDGSWGINVSRASLDSGKQQISTFAPMNGSLHQSKDFAALKMPVEAIADLRWSATLTEQSRLFPKGGQLVFQNDLSVANHTDSYRFFEVRSKLTRDGESLGESTQSRGLDGGADGRFTLGVPLPMDQGKGKAKLTTTVVNRDSGRVLSVDQKRVSLDYTPITIQLTQPVYRNSIYATQDIDAIEGKLMIRLADADLAGRAANVALLDSDDKPVAKVRLQKLTHATEFKLPLPDSFDDGDYRLSVELPAAGDEPAYDAEQSVHKFPAPRTASEVRINGQGLTLVDGKPFLPFGFMGVQPKSDLPYVARQGYNVIHTYNFYWWDDDQRLAWLNQLQGLGMKAIVFPYPSPDMRRDKETRDRALNEDEKKQLRAFVEKWSHHPALLAWYIEDEPGHKNILPQRLKQVHEICVEADPYHPTIMLNMRTRAIETYGPYSDVLMPDPYPRFTNNGLSVRGIDYVHRFTSVVNELARPSQGNWLTPQAFSYGDIPRLNHPDDRAPNLIELRNMTYQSVYDQTTGWVFYTYHSGRKFPQIRYGLGLVAREVQRLKPAIAAVQTNRPLKSEPGEDKLLVTHRTANGQQYVFAVNVSKKPIEEARIRLPDSGQAKWYVVSEDRQVRASGRMLRDRFDTYATHIYTTDPALAGGQTLDQMQALVDRGQVLSKSDEKTPAAEFDASLKK